MPELPEVEITRQGIAPHICAGTVRRVVVRERRLRWPVPPAIERELPGQVIDAVERRAKYLLLRTRAGSAIVHLGMSGSLRIVTRSVAPTRHDHVDIVLQDNQCLRLHDPRRFGALLWTRTDPGSHPLLQYLGPEPFDPCFDGRWLYAAAGKRRVAVKNLIMDARTVAGVGNIYANEALFVAGIHPARAAGRIARRRYDALAAAIREVLHDAIEAGGTTLRDFVGADGRPGYFSQRLRVYGRDGQPCVSCASTLIGRVIGQRASVYCPTCQH
jgi:formamidopyrimidine-DNA glycosylase